MKRKGPIIVLLAYCAYLLHMLVKGIRSERVQYKRKVHASRDDANRPSNSKGMRYVEREDTVTRNLLIYTGYGSVLILMAFTVVLGEKA